MRPHPAFYLGSLVAESMIFYGGPIWRLFCDKSYFPEIDILRATTFVSLLGSTADIGFLASGYHKRNGLITKIRSGPFGFRM